MVWTNGDVGIKDIRYTSTEPRYTEHIVTERYYRISRQDMITEAQRADAGRTIVLQYGRFAIPPSDPMASILDAAQAAGRSMASPGPGIAYVYCLSKGFGGINPLEYPGDTRFSIGPQFSQKVDEYRTTWGKFSQPLMVISVPIDIVTSPFQAVFFLWRLDKAWVG